MNSKEIVDFLLNVISPPRCLSCNVRMPIKSKAMFCYDCSKSYFKNNGTVCDICGKPIYENRDRICARCKQERIYYIKNVSRYKYKGCIKTAIQNMKFKRRAWIAEEFGQALSKTVTENYGDIKFDMVLFVPMSPLNEFTRGFNQSFEIADVISKNIDVPVNKKILFKRPLIKTQSGLNRNERIENVKKAFYVKNSHLLTDKTVLLIDDVITTGSTLNACAKVLKKNGALAVYGATVSTVVAEE